MEKSINGAELVSLVKRLPWFSRDEIVASVNSLLNAAKRCSELDGLTGYLRNNVSIIEGVIKMGIENTLYMDMDVNIPVHSTFRFLSFIGQINKGSLVTSIEVQNCLSIAGFCDFIVANLSEISEQLPTQSPESSDGSLTSFDPNGGAKPEEDIDSVYSSLSPNSQAKMKSLLPVLEDIIRIISLFMLKNPLLADFMKENGLVWVNRLMERSLPLKIKADVITLLMKLHNTNPSIRLGLGKSHLIVIKDMLLRPRYTYLAAAYTEAVFKNLPNRPDLLIPVKDALLKQHFDVALVNGLILCPTENDSSPFWTCISILHHSEEQLSKLFEKATHSLAKALCRLVTPPFDKTDKALRSAALLLRREQVVLQRREHLLSTGVLGEMETLMAFNKAAELLETIETCDIKNPTYAQTAKEVLNCLEPLTVTNIPLLTQQNQGLEGLWGLVDDNNDDEVGPRAPPCSPTFAKSTSNPLSIGSNGDTLSDPEGEMNTNNTNNAIDDGDDESPEKRKGKEKQLKKKKKKKKHESAVEDDGEDNTSSPALSPSIVSKSKEKSNIQAIESSALSHVKLGDLSMNSQFAPPPPKNRRAVTTKLPPLPGHDTSFYSAPNTASSNHSTLPLLSLET